MKNRLDSFGTRTFVNLLDCDFTHYFFNENLKFRDKNIYQNYKNDKDVFDFTNTFQEPE